MEPAFQRRCCEPFEQATRWATRAFEVAGLVLTVAKAFIERCGGVLDIASAPGEGALVRITLPRRPGTAALPGGAVRPPVSRAATR